MADPQVAAIQHGVVGLVLAGGKSTRMGQDKAQLILDGKTWLEKCVSLLESCGVESVMVNMSGESPYQQVTEPYPEQGPLSGIYAGLVATANTLVVLPVDMPTLSQTNLNKLIASASQQSVVFFKDSPLPCRITNNQTIREQLKALLTDASSSKSLFKAWRKLGAEEIDPVDALDNFNTPHDVKHRLP